MSSNHPVNWALFEGYHQQFPEDLEDAFAVEGMGYCDDEIADALSSLKIPNFNVNHWIPQTPAQVKTNHTINTYIDTVNNGVILQWIDTNNASQNRMELLYSTEGDWIFAIQENKNFLGVSILCGHPFVYSNSFSFGNSDGSTDVHMNPLDYQDPNILLEWMLQLTHQFLYDQIH